MATYSVGDLADLIAGAGSEGAGEELFRPKKKKCKTTEYNEEIIMSPKKKKKRKSIGEVSAIREDVDTTQNENSATPAGQKLKHTVDKDPPEENHAPEAVITSKKKKKRKSVGEVGATGENVDTVQNEEAATPAGQNLQHIENKDPPEETSAPEPVKTSKKKKKKRKLVGEVDVIREDVDTVQNEEATTLAGQKRKHVEDKDPPEEASAPEAVITSKKKKKKRKSVGEVDAIREDVDTVQNEEATTPAGQKRKHVEDKDPPEEASAPEAVTTSHKKKKKRKKLKSEEVFSAIDVDTVQNENSDTPAGQKFTHAEDKDPPEETSVPEAATTSKKKKKKKKKKFGGEISAVREDGDKAQNEELGGSADVQQAERSVQKRNLKKVTEEQVDEKSKVLTQGNSGKETGEEVTSREEVPKEVPSSGLKPSKKIINSNLKTSGKKLLEKPKQIEKVLNKLEKENQSSDTQDTSEKPMQKEKVKLMRREKKLLKEKRIAESLKNSLPAKHPDAEERTVYVGNVHIDTKRKMIAKLFSAYGKVETVRLRNIAVAELNMSKKEAVVKKMFHPKRTSMVAYVRFVDKESVEKALEANGTELKGHHLIVNRSKKEASEKPKHAAFIGNLPWEAQEEELYKHFIDCGDILSVRIIRDKKLGSGKGFGYVNFKSRDALEVALQLSGKDFGGRALRVKRAVKKVKLKEEYGTKQKERVLPGHQPKMKLDFMKKSKGKQLEKEEFARKQKKIDFSGVKTSNSGTLVKGKGMKLNKDEKKKAFIAHKLAGDKSSAQFGRPKINGFEKPASSKPFNNAKSSQRIIFKD